MQLYDKVYIYINGKLLAENTSVSTSLESDQQEVKTLVRGFAGISPTVLLPVISRSMSSHSPSGAGSS